LICSKPFLSPVVLKEKIQLMANLTTDYLGIKLDNPIVVGACDLVENPENLVKLQKAGAGAIVYKSLFEEQIQLEDLDLHFHLHDYNDRNAEMTRLFPEMDYTGPRNFITKLKKAREIVHIPLIASLNAIYHETWVKYAEELATSGVDALELNFFNVPYSFDTSATEVEDEQIKVVKEIIARVKIPVSVKIGPYYSSPPAFIKKLDDAGVKGIVLFNKFFQPEVDIEQVKHITPWNLSGEKDYRLALRFAGLLHGEIKAQVIGNQGIYQGEDVVKLILAGAQAVQVVSTIYKNGVDQISRMRSTLDQWLDEKGFKSPDEIRGRLSRSNTLNPFVYKRAQYIDMLLKSEQLIGRPVL